MCPVPPCTPPSIQHLASPQPISSHLHMTSFISTSPHRSAVLTTTLTLTEIGFAVGASEAPVPLKANSTLVHRPLPLSLHPTHSPLHSSSILATTSAPTPMPTQYLQIAPVQHHPCIRMSLPKSSHSHHHIHPAPRRICNTTQPEASSNLIGPVPQPTAHLQSRTRASPCFRKSP